MKYLVELKFTNPSHEHVSLRRRVEKITRLVEAANETEALNRAANQQRALGFMIKEAVILKKPEVMSEEVEQVDEAGKGYGPGWMLKHPDGKTLAAKLKAKKELEKARQKSYGDPKAGISVKKEEVEQIDEVKAVKAYDKEGKLVGRYRSMEHAKQMKPGHTYKVDESSHKPLLPAQKAVQAKVDAESKKQLAKKPQAGTLAAAKMRTEGKVNVVDNKKNKVNLALNKMKARKSINMNPTLDAEKK